MTKRHSVLAAMWGAVTMTLAVGNSSPTRAEPGMHIVFGTARTFHCSIKESFEFPNMQTRTWILYAPVAPTTETQSNPTGKFFPAGVDAVPSVVREGSVLHRPIYGMMLHVPAGDVVNQTRLDCEVDYTVTERPRWLAAGPPRSPVSGLNAATRTACLAASPTIDYTDKVFQSWLDKNSLHRRKHETDIAFAKRAFETIRPLYVYQWLHGEPPACSEVCRRDHADCGRISCLFVSTLRANGIPARALVGHTLDNRPSADDPMHLHVVSEFFATAIGWVPVDMSAAISDHNKAENEIFGRENGAFMTMHTDVDMLVDSIYFGTRNEWVFQTPIAFVQGTGTVAGFSTSGSWLVTTPDKRAVGGP